MMKSDAEQRFKDLMKEVVEGERYQAKLKEKYVKAGRENPPDVATLLAKAEKRKRKFDFTKQTKLLKASGFVIAILFVSVVINVAGNSTFVSASMFEINSFLFSLRNGFVATDFQFNSTLSGKELLIEKEEQIPIGKRFVRELKIPRYIPDGYNFSFLQITNNPRNEYRAMFLYKNDNGNVIIISQEKILLHSVVRQLTGVEKELFLNGAQIFYAPPITCENGIIFIFTSSDFIEISGQLTLEELLHIFEMLE